MLLVGYHKSQVEEFDRILNKGVSADYDIYLAGFKLLVNVPLFLCGRRAYKYLNFYTEALV